MSNQQTKIPLPANIKLHINGKDVDATLVYMEKTTKLAPIILLSGLVSGIDFQTETLITLQDLIAKVSPNSGSSWKGRFSILDRSGRLRKMGSPGLETTRDFSKLVKNGDKSIEVKSFLKRLTKDNSKALGSVQRQNQQAKRTKRSHSDSSVEGPSKKRRTNVASSGLRTDKEGAKLQQNIRSFLASRAKAMMFKQRASDQIDALSETLELGSLIEKTARRQRRGPK